MKVTFNIGRTARILCLLLLFIASGTVSIWSGTDTVKKVSVKSKKTDHSVSIIKQADEAVVPVFTVKLCQQVFVVFERCFYVISNEKPRHANKYPIFRSAFFANIFSNTIAINAP